MNFSSLIIIAGLSVALPSLAASPNINEGEWEFESRMDMPGMPKNMPAQRFKSCMNKNDPVPRGVDRHSDDKSCKTTHQFITDTSATWTVSCTHGKQVMETKGKGTYHGNTMEAVQTVQTGSQTMTIKFNGRRIGPCKK